MLAGLFLLLPTAACDRLGPFLEPLDRQETPALAVRAERLIVRPGEEIENGTLLIERGVVIAAGKDVAVPEGVEVLTGKVACAGFVDPWSSLGLDPTSVGDMGTTPSTRAVDALNPWYRPDERTDALRSGVTAARVQTGQRAVFAGIGALVHTEEDTHTAVLLEDACLASTIGISRGGRAPDVFDRVTEVDRLIGALEKGKRYRESQIDYRAELEKWTKAIVEKATELEKDFKKAKKDREKEEKEAKEKSKEFKEKKYKEDKKPRRVKLDPDDEALARVVDGEVPLVVEVHRASEIRRLLDKTEPFDRLRLVVAGGAEALPFADELVERDIPVIVWPTPMGSARPDEYRENDLSMAGDLARAGVRVLIGSGGGSDARELRFLAALAVGHGMDPAQALDAITAAPARVFDVADRVGTLERGRSADVLVFDGDPLDTSAPLRFVISRGRVVVR